MLGGVDNAKPFADKAKQKQDMTDLRVDSKFSWLEPYCTVYRCSEQTLDWKQSMQPFKTFRLGGDVTRVFEPEKSSGS
ncbi:Alginate lyase precursor [compost metagenome]